MANVYSQLLISVHNIGIGTPTVGGIVPSGFIWVLRDIVAINLGASGTWTSGFYIYDTFDSVPLWSCPPYGSQTWAMYHTEMRQVLQPGHQLNARVLTANWNIRISGYALSLP